ncbi:hypothetical protein F4604DRAFT_1947906 [Suillus subluteus]|nr:hypothetical protein F4604DRAFT_1947906 [Suillus subluteus]
MKRYLEVLWVRWLATLRNYKAGINHAPLPKIVFVEESDPDAFGVGSLRYRKSLARPGGELDDWEEHYVGIVGIQGSSEGQIVTDLFLSLRAGIVLYDKCIANADGLEEVLSKVKVLVQNVHLRGGPLKAT